MTQNVKRSKKSMILIVLLIVAVIGAAVLFAFLFDTHKQLEDCKASLHTTQDSLAGMTLSYEKTSAELENNKAALSEMTAQKEAVDTKNQAESVIFQTEKALSELGDKVTEEEKAPITEKLEALKAVVANGSTEDIKKATEELTQAFYAISEKLYKQANPDGGAGATGGVNPDGSVNGDFEDTTGN